MFENLSDRLSGVLDRLTKQGALSEEDVKTALREVRVALLEADVSLPVARDFIRRVEQEATGQAVTKSVTPGQQVVKIVHDALVATLRGEGDPGALRIDNPPAPVLMVGLQGSGKTTTSAKLARRFRLRDKKRVLLASLDVYRPAAQQQLEVLAKQAEVGSLPIVFGEKPVAIAERAMKIAAREGYDVVILDTAGRLHIDDVLMDEVAAVKSKARPHETILVADAMTGQDAVTIAKTFQDRVGLTGIALTRVDGDARGGAALAMRSVTGKPIKLLGQGEKLDQLETFHPERIASRILGMGDVVSLVEKAAETIDREEAEKLAAKIQKGTGFDLDDMAKQLRQLRKMGGMKGMLGMLPGVAKMKAQLNDAKLDEKILVRQEAIIMSMTPKERRNPEIIKASRKKRIAAGSGSSVQDVNKLLKQHQDMAKMMKQVGKLGKKGMMRGGLQNLLPRM